ncbi:unnamed protein product [Rhodiola kirilowii]
MTASLSSKFRISSYLSLAAVRVSLSINNWSVDSMYLRPNRICRLSSSVECFGGFHIQRLCLPVYAP